MVQRLFVQSPSGPLAPFNPADVTFDAASIDPSAIRHSLDSCGCAWIKGLFDRHRLAEFDGVIAHNIEGIESIYDELGIKDDYSVSFPIYFAARRDRTRVQQIFRASHPAAFNPSGMRGTDTARLANFVFASLRRRGLSSLIARWLKMTRIYSSAALSHLRSLKPRGQWRGDLHQDASFFDPSASLLTLWFPLRYEHGLMPSLELLPFRGQTIISGAFDPEAFWRPGFQLGDAVLFTGFFPHRTYVEDGMTMERTSCDFRFYAKRVPAPLYDPPHGAIDTLDYLAHRASDGLRGLRALARSAYSTRSR